MPGVEEMIEVMQVQHEQSQEKVIQALQHQVDELTAANLLLQDQLVRKEQFTAMIAHELRGPLSPIINYAQLLARQARSLKDAPEAVRQKSREQETLQRSTNIIISQARRLSRLVNDLLDASRLSSGQFTLLREQCDLAVLAQELVEQLRPVAPYHRLVVEVSATPVSGNWDSGRLQQVLGNLLDNAIKYSDEHTTITVSVGCCADMARVSVHNEGPGIPSANIDRLFHPYARLPESSGREGSGLGLYIARSIIEAHGGTLCLEAHGEGSSRAESKGTTFTFELPLH